MFFFLIKTINSPFLESKTIILTVFKRANRTQNTLQELQVHRSIWFLPENIDTAVAVGEEEHVVVVVPGDLVDFELELLLSPGAVRLGIDKGHHIVFVPDCDCLTVWTPADINVLTLSF